MEKEWVKFVMIALTYSFFVSNNGFEVMIQKHLKVAGGVNLVIQALLFISVIKIKLYLISLFQHKLLEGQ